MSACEGCLRRSWLLARLASHLETARSRIEPVLRLPDAQLLAAVGGPRRTQIEDQLERLDGDEVRAGAESAGLKLLCRCDRAYPPRLTALPSPPAVLYVAGDLERFVALAVRDPVAIVGARRASAYGLDTARSLGRGLARAGVTVVSGMALGIDSAAHAGALAGGAATVAVLPGSADRPYPPGKRSLYRRIRDGGAIVSELPPGTEVWRWMFPARNRIIAALASTTVVVEAGERSGALVTARFARELGRPLGAVPGRVITPQAAGPHGLLASGAYLVRGPQDVLDAVFGEGVRLAAREDRVELPPELQTLLAAIADGNDTAGALAHAGVPAEHGLAALASLELAGYVRRGPGGRYSVIA
jgi:DNA processing protein